APPSTRWQAFGAVRAPASDEEDWEQIDECYFRIRSALTLTFPDGTPVAEFMLHIHDDGTAGWRWHDSPSCTPRPR
ncbi:hypothetical protein ACFV6U_38100, partial [Streptomyces sp. NPDC059810]